MELYAIKPQEHDTMSKLKRCSILLLAVIIFALDNAFLKAIPAGTEPFKVIALSSVIATPLLALFFHRHLRAAAAGRCHLIVFLIAVSFTAYNYFNIASLAYISVNTASFLFL